MTAVIVVVGIIFEVGMAVLIYKMYKKIFTPPIIAKNLQEGQKLRLEAGKYGLWGNANSFGANRARVENPVLLNTNMEKIAMWSYRYFRVGTTAMHGMVFRSRLLYTFSVSSGEYTFHLEDKPYIATWGATQGLEEVFYSVRKKAPILCYLGFAFGIIGVNLGMFATIYLETLLATGRL